MRERNFWELCLDCQRRFEGGASPCYFMSSCICPEHPYEVVTSVFYEGEIRSREVQWGGKVAAQCLLGQPTSGENKRGGRKPPKDTSENGTPQFVEASTRTCERFLSSGSGRTSTCGHIYCSEVRALRWPLEHPQCKSRRSLGVITERSCQGNRGRRETSPLPSTVSSMHHCQSNLPKAQVYFMVNLLKNLSGSYGLEKA